MDHQAAASCPSVIFLNSHSAWQDFGRTLRASNANSGSLTSRHLYSPHCWALDHLDHPNFSVPLQPSLLSVENILTLSLGLCTHLPLCPKCISIQLCHQNSVLSSVLKCCCFWEAADAPSSLRLFSWKYFCFNVCLF